MEKVVGFFLSSTGTLVFFVIALGASFFAQNAMLHGTLSKANTLAWVSLAAACVLVVQHLAIWALGGSALTGLLSFLWGYVAWRDWQLLKQIQVKGSR